MVHNHSANNFAQTTWLPRGLILIPTQMAAPFFSYSVPNSFCFSCFDPETLCFLFSGQNLSFPAKLPTPHVEGIEELEALHGSEQGCRLAHKYLSCHQRVEGLETNLNLVHGTIYGHRICTFKGMVPLFLRMAQPTPRMRCAQFLYQ